MGRFKVGVIGTGTRSVVYASAYAGREDVAVVALADPVAEHRRAMVARAGLDGQAAEYDDWRAMLDDHADLDGVVIGSPNHLHADQAVACLDRGLAVALEKPLATTEPDARRIVRAERAGSGRALVGFVLRSTPFYGKVRELIAGGAVGRVVSVQADELPGYAVTSVMTRSPWRRRQATAGGAMLEKSCHDMDVLNWLLGDRPSSLNSYGGELIFRPDPARPRVCEGCRLAEACPYHRPAHEPGTPQIAREEARCIYNVDKDCADVQSVCVEYAGGAVANFMLAFNCAGPRAGRNLHVVGCDGRIWGNMGESKVFRYDNAGDEAAAFDTSGDGTGHGGGDRMHALELVRMMAEPDYRPAADAYAGYLSAVMCFAADASRLGRRRVDFRYDADGFVELS